MEEIKPSTQTGYGVDENQHNGKKFFNPMDVDGITPRCICGYELLIESDGTYRCSGGKHRYRMQQGEVAFDKFGNPLLSVPSDMQQKEKKNEN